MALAVGAGQHRSPLGVMNGRIDVEVVVAPGHPDLSGGVTHGRTLVTFPDPGDVHGLAGEDLGVEGTIEFGRTWGVGNTGGRHQLDPLRSGPLTVLRCHRQGVLVVAAVLAGLQGGVGVRQLRLDPTCLSRRQRTIADAAAGNIEPFGKVQDEVAGLLSVAVIGDDQPQPPRQS